ncbi:MAG: small GTP-binding protein [Promethearchaeota archaeon CR_4]|nr:MAG: small GTP-binding protein [Candidatus Lokiarchaeota archaeon CR_4]
MALIEFKMKLILLGESAVGKTSLIKAFVDKVFSTDYRPTIGANIFIKRVEVGDNRATLTIWDIAGQERWQLMRTAYYRGSNIIFLVADCTRKESFQQLENFWIPDVREQIGIEIPIYLLANKIDLEREVSGDGVKEWAEKIGANHVFETSAKTGVGVNQAFEQTLKDVLSKV